MLEVERHLDLTRLVNERRGQVIDDGQRAVVADLGCLIVGFNAGDTWTRLIVAEPIFGRLLCGSNKPLGSGMP